MLNVKASTASAAERVRIGSFATRLGAVLIGLALTAPLAARAQEQPPTAKPEWGGSTTL